MQIIATLFKELIYRFPLHFIFLFGLILCQAIFNILSVIAVAPITDFLMEKRSEESNIITQNLELFLSNYGIGLSLLSVCIFYAGLMAMLKSDEIHLISLKLAKLLIFSPF